MKLSCVIIARDEEELLPRCIDSLSYEIGRASCRERV